MQVEFIHSLHNGDITGIITVFDEVRCIIQAVRCIDNGRHDMLSYIIKAGMTQISGIDGLITDPEPLSIDNAAGSNERAEHEWEKTE